MVFLNELMPDILISSGGALVKYKTEYIYRAEFSEEETNVMIDMARNICGNDCEITIDTIDAHYWNYKIDPKKLDKSWGDSIYTDFSDFNECSLKCVSRYLIKIRQISWLEVSLIVIVFVSLMDFGTSLQKRM